MTDVNDTTSTPDEKSARMAIAIGRMYGDHAEWAQLVATLMAHLYPAPLDHPTVRHSAASVGHRLTAAFEDREKLRAQLTVANTDLRNTREALEKAQMDERHLMATAAARLREVNVLNSVHNDVHARHRHEIAAITKMLDAAKAKLEHDRVSAEAGARLASETFQHLSRQLDETKVKLAESQQTCRDLQYLLEQRGAPKPDGAGARLLDALMNRGRELTRDLRSVTAERDALRVERGKFREWLGDDRTFHRIVTSERSEIWKWRGSAEQASPTPTESAGAGPAGPTPAAGSTVNMTGATINVTVYLAEEDDGQPD